MRVRFAVSRDMQKAQTTVEPVLLQQLAKALENLRYGVIELTIHDGRIVQIERREKIRLATRSERAS
jgi:hypothetical protein